MECSGRKVKRVRSRNRELSFQLWELRGVRKKSGSFPSSCESLGLVSIVSWQPRNSTNCRLLNQLNDLAQADGQPDTILRNAMNRTRHTVDGMIICIAL